MNKVISIAAFLSLLVGCDQTNSSGNVGSSKDLVDKLISNMVHVQGGEFLMGDFGPLVEENLPYSIQQDDKILHKVVLDDYSIS